MCITNGICNNDSDWRMFIDSPIFESTLTSWCRIHENKCQRKKFIIIVSGVYIALLYTALNFFLFVFSLTCIIFINRRVSFIVHCRCGNINFGNRKACLLCRGKQISDETENSGMCTLLWFRICIPVRTSFQNAFIITNNRMVKC